ncbi:MAG TPA: thioredoxin domain-containing protein [Candidatus Acidoferrales bacterium]|nr:thioredoxin domain-containing protein [Candidatus Acidoferrales bacterium]
MYLRIARGWVLPALIAAATTLLLAQDWQTATTLNGVELAGLTPARKAIALKAMRMMGCSCGCDMKVAECRVKDPSCSYSKGLAASIVDSVRAGKSETDAIEAAKATKWAHRPEPKLLDDPVQIPTQGAPATGPANARITLVEFSDFQCPYCSKAAVQIAAILKAYPKDVKLIFKQYPLDSHPQAQICAQGALAAHQQGKFWQLHDLMFANRSKLSRQAILLWAQTTGVDMKRFTADLDSPAIKKAVARDVADGDKAGVEGTPTVFIDGQRYNGDLDLAKIKTILDKKLH